MKENDTIQLLKETHKEFTGFLSKGIFELIPRIIVAEGETIFPTVWVIKRNNRL